MNNGASILYAEVVEDFPFSALFRVTSLSGTGAEVVQGEGPLVKQADVASVTCKVFDLGTDRDADTGVEVTPAPTYSAANVFDTLRTAGWPGLPERDLFGYNARFDVAATFLADPEEWRLIEWTITLTDGSPVPLQARVKTLARMGS